MKIKDTSQKADLYLENFSRHNPFVKAIQQLRLTKSELEERLTNRPDVINGFEYASASTKEIAIDKSLYLTPPYAIDIYSRLLTLMTMGYLNRHPAESDYDKYIHLSDINEAPAPESLNDSGSSVFVFGCSGAGKTQLFERLLDIMGTSIEHPPSEYTGHRKLTQLLWVKLDMKLGDSRSAFYRNVIEKIDAVLDTNFATNMPSGDSKDERFLYMIKVCRMVCLGLFVIDDVQWAMSETNRANEKKVTNQFLESLFNQLGVPIVFIGTPESKTLEGLREQTGRRLSHNGRVEINLHKVKSTFWQNLVRILFVNFLNMPEQNVTEEFFHVIHYYTEGNGDRLQSIVFNLLRKELDGDITFEQIFSAYKEEKEGFEVLKSPYSAINEASKKGVLLSGLNGNKEKKPRLEPSGDETSFNSDTFDEFIDEDDDEFEDQFIHKGNVDEF